MPYNGLGSEVAWWCPSLQDDSASSTVTDLTTNSYDLTNLNTDATKWVRLPCFNHPNNHINKYIL